MSFPSASEIARYPKLLNWLKEGSWRVWFDSGALRRSQAYATNGSINDIQVGRSEEFEDIIGITATVRGTRAKPYDVYIGIPEEGRLDEPEALNVDIECTCPVEFECKHGAAVLGKLFAIVREPSVTKPAFRDDSPSALGRKELIWMNSLRTAAERDEASGKKKQAENQFLAYCIEPDRFLDDGEMHQFVIRNGTRSHDGELRIRDSIARADPANPSSFMREEDIPLAALYHSIHKRGSFDSGMRGSGWAHLIRGALDVGRLFYRDPGDGFKASNAGPPVPLASGKAVHAEPGWETLDDGSARPVVRLDRDGAVLLLVEPLHYVDVGRGEIGFVETRVSANLIENWSQGPKIRADDVPAIGDQLALINSTAPLPAPRELPVQTITGLAPVPCLRVCRFQSRGTYGFDTIIGELSFRYGDSPPLYPLTNRGSARESWVGENDTRTILERDRKAEKKFERGLHERELMSLHELFRPSELRPETLHAVVIADPYPSLELAWLTWIEQHAENLRAAGWTVEIDPDSGLIIHDIRDFVPAIEADPDHGIDWFRFELDGDFGDRKVSLLPYVADMIAEGLPALDDPELPEFFVIPSAEPEDGHLRIPARRFLEICHHVAQLFRGRDIEDDELRTDRLMAAGVADALEIDGSATARSLAALGKRLRDVQSMPASKPPRSLQADLRPYQLDGYRWLRFLAENGLHGILADDMGLGKTVQTLAFLASRKRSGPPSLVVAPTSVVGNWVGEAGRFAPTLKVLLLHGKERASHFDKIPKSHLVVTSYPLLTRDHETLAGQEWDTVVLDEAQYIKNPKTAAAQRACELRAAHRFCLSGTPMENHLGELWSLMHFLMPGFLGNEKTFSSLFRRPIERRQDGDAQLALNRRVAPLILRRTKDEVASELPPKTEIIHTIDLGKKEIDLYESVRAAMDKRVRDALREKGLAKSHIIVLDALLKLRQICCHPSLLSIKSAKTVKDGSKLDFLTRQLLPELIEEGRRILLFSQFTSMLALIEAELGKAGTPFLKLTGKTRNRTNLVKRFQEGDTPVFLISLKAGGTGLNLTAADTVIHYDPWWNPAAENQATDRAHRIGQDKPVFVHKLICRGSIEDRILELQRHKSALVQALLSEETAKLKIDSETLSHLLAPLS